VQTLTLAFDDRAVRLLDGDPFALAMPDLDGPRPEAIFGDAQLGRSLARASELANRVLAKPAARWPRLRSGKIGFAGHF
jgi:hypothetical protein